MILPIAQEVVMKSKYKEILSWVLTFVVAIVIAQLLTRYVVVNANIPSESMENTIMEGDRLLANRLSYINSTPERGDIVIFKYPVDESKLYIKRVIGLPNETVEIIDGKIYINDSAEPIEENYLPEEWTVKNDGFKFIVPDGYYLMLGDNRNHSSDSRYWKQEALDKGIADTEEEAEIFQYVSEENILGKALLRYWPMNEFTTF